MSLPTFSKYVIVGAGIHGLSTAYHLALGLKARTRGSGKDIVVLDKEGVAAGASGIACGVIRNNYFQPAMRELMAHSVEIWETDPEAFSYHPVGYMQISPESMHADIASVYEQQQAIGYDSEFIEGEERCLHYMRGILHDWEARGITSVLHEKKGGYANNRESMLGLAEKAKGEGVDILTGVRVEGLDFSGGAVSAVETNLGRIETESVVIGVGPWIKSIWEMLDLPKEIGILADGVLHEGVRMWTYWCLQEGTLGVEPDFQQTNAGGMPPVIHVDADEPLYSDIDGERISDGMWGVYYKPDLNFGGVQGGAMPYKVEGDPDEVKVDPYGPKSPEYVAGDEFARIWCSALAFCQARFKGKYPLYKSEETSGGLGCFTPDSFPVFDVFRENCYIIADSNHGYKMLGVGKLVADELLGEKSRLLEPFRFSRYREGRLHPVSHSPFPWS